MDRRRFLQHAFGTGLVLAAGPAIVRAQGAGASAALPAMTVYKSATCGCCRNWVQHARGAGFPVRVVDTEDLDRVKASLKRALIVDGRNLYRCETMQEHGFDYASVGRATVRGAKR